MERSWCLSSYLNGGCRYSNASGRDSQTMNTEIIRLITINIKKLRIWTFVNIRSTHIIWIRSSERVVQVVRSRLLRLNVAVTRLILLLTNYSSIKLCKIEECSIILPVAQRFSIIFRICRALIIVALAKLWHFLWSFLLFCTHQPVPQHHLLELTFIHHTFVIWCHFKPWVI